jgi:hypothetical protein
MSEVPLWVVHPCSLADVSSMGCVQQDGFCGDRIGSRFGRIEPEIAQYPKST